MDFNLVFLIPHYNHPKITELVGDLLGFGYKILIVDDGSDEKNVDNIKRLSALDGVTVLFLQKNMGKGYAIKKAFKYALENQITHLFQIDADYQHSCDNINSMISLAQKYPQKLILSYPVYGDDAPNIRVKGRKITNFWIYINTLGCKVKDGMCGFRIYPVFSLEHTIKKTLSNRMEFDIEIIINACKDNINLLFEPQKVNYHKDGISHFRMFKDNLLISKMHARCFLSLPKFILKKLFGGRFV